MFENKKSKSSWALQIGELRLDVVKASRPKLTLSKPGEDIKFEELQITMLDNAEPSTSHIVMTWLSEQIQDAQYSKAIILAMTNDKGDIIEKWEYEGVKIKYIDFGDLTIYDQEPITISMWLSYEQVILHNNDK